MGEPQGTDWSWARVGALQADRLRVATIQIPGTLTVAAALRSESKESAHQPERVQIGPLDI